MASAGEDRPYTERSGIEFVGHPLQSTGHPRELVTSRETERVFDSHRGTEPRPGSLLPPAGETDAAMTGKRIWIMDGHNIIFAVPSLQSLQVSDRRDEARQTLAERLERFAHTRGEKVLIVFDGMNLPSNPDANRRGIFEVTYMHQGEGGADTRIIYEARQRLEQGHPVTVVTNDVSTLARHLPRSVDHLGVREFWLKHIDKRAASASSAVSSGDRSPAGGDNKEFAARRSPIEALKHGMQPPSWGGWAGWNRRNSAPTASATPAACA